MGTAATVGCAGTGQGVIDPELRDKSGTVSGVVRLTTNAVTDVRDRDTRAGVVEGLKRHAASTQQRIIEYADATPGIEIRRQFWLTNAILVTIDTELASVADLAGFDKVERIHRTGTGGEHADLGDRTPTAPQTGQDRDVSYGLEMMHVPDVWERFGTRGEGTRIAVLDTGVDPSHPDIDLAEWAEFDADGNQINSEPYDPQGHGTGMSSLATGGDASGTQIGVAPDAELLVARVSNDDFFTSTLAGLEWAVENDADAVSISLDIGPLKHESIEAVSNANATGTVVIAPGYGPKSFLSPSAQYSVLSAGAVDRSREPYNGGNGGEIQTGRYWRSEAVPDDWPERYVVPTAVTAGVDVLAAAPDNDNLDGGHVREDGYSNGPPHLSGVVALLRSIDSSLSPARIKQIIQETAEQPGKPYEHEETNTDFGHGIANAAAAAAEVGGSDQTVSGTVTGPDGEPLRDVTVTTVTGDTTETDESGQYTLSVPSGTATVTAETTGYEPVTRRVTPENGGDISVTSEVRPDIQLASRPPTHVAPGETVAIEFDIEHAEFATIRGRESPHIIDISAVSGRINGEPVPVEEPTEIGAQSTLTVELEISDGARGTLPLSISLAAGTQNATIDLDPIHVHERPMRVTEEQDIQAAIDAAAPETTILLDGDQWERTVETRDPPLPEGRYSNPTINNTRGDKSAVVIDTPLTLRAAEGREPTIAVSAGSSDRTFGLQIASHFLTLEDIEVTGGGAMGAISVLASDGVHLLNVDLSGATNGVYAQFSKSPVVSGSTISATESGIALRDLSVNALVDGNTVRDAETGVFLSGRTDERLFAVDATVTGNTFEGVGDDIDTEGTATIRDGSGETKQVGGEPPENSMLDIVLYAATATTIGALFYPYARRRLGGIR
jgi:hypothetical protein